MTFTNETVLGRRIFIWCTWQVVVVMRVGVGWGGVGAGLAWFSVLLLGDMQRSLHAQSLSLLSSVSVTTFVVF